MFVESMNVREMLFFVDVDCVMGVDPKFRKVPRFKGILDLTGPTSKLRCFYIKM